MNAPLHPISIARVTLGIMMFSGICLGACTPMHHPDSGENAPQTGSESVDAEHAPAIIAVVTQPATQIEPDQSDEPVIDVAPAKTDPARNEEVKATPETRPENANLDEVISLYRRLHTELDAAQRSALITELLSDPRRRILELGFELAHRNLSARTPLNTSVGDATTKLLSSPTASIRGQAAGLLTRLVTPDAMLQLTEALNREQDPIAAEAMLLGVARWPNADATNAVVAWCIRDDAPFAATATAAWAFEQSHLLDDPEIREQLLNALRARDHASLSPAGMKLFAKLGDASDLQRLAQLLATDDVALRDRVAGALAETPRATELLARAAETDQKLYAPAGEALIRHRPTPAGLQRLASLKPLSEPERTEMLVRMGSALPIESLAEGVALAGLDDTIAARLLERLLSSDAPRTPRTFKGIMLLAEIELRLGRPDQALDIADSIASDIADPIELTRLTNVQQQAAISARVFDHSSLTDSQPAVWFHILDQTTDDRAKRNIAEQIRDRFETRLTSDQLTTIDAITLKPESTSDEEG